MTIHLIAAPPASGKTTACIQRIRDVRAAEPFAPIWILVPDRLNAAAYRRRLADAGGALGVYVGTFRDLHRKILERAGVNLPVTSPPLTHRLIQETVDRAVKEGALPRHAALQGYPGFYLVLRDIFAELERSHVSPHAYVEQARKRSPAQEELAALYARYQERLEKLGWTDPEGSAWLSIERLKGDEGSASFIRLLVIDGFDTFTGTQRAALKQLCQQVGETWITLPGLMETTRTAHRRFTPEIQTLIQELSPRVEPFRTSTFLPPDLAHIESEIFEAEKERRQVTGSLSLLEARSPEEEAREALRWIKRLVLRQGMALSDCAVFTPNPEPYQPALRSAAAEFGIPIHFSQAEPLRNSPAITALLNLLNLPGLNFRTNALINFLRSPYFDHGISPADIDALDTISRTARIVEGRGQWQETWDRLVPTTAPEDSDLDDERTLPGLPRGARAGEMASLLNSLFHKLTPPGQTLPLTEWITWFEDILEDLHFYQTADSERDKIACAGFRDTLRALVLSEAVAGTRPVSYEQFAVDLAGTLEGVGVQETTFHSVSALFAGQMMEARGVRFQAVAILGLSEGLFPAVEHPDPFLDESLRRRLGLEQRLLREQAGLFYQAVTRADQHLLLTRPYLSGDGEAWEESPYWKAVKDLFDPSPVIKIRPDDPRPLAEAASAQEVLFQAARSQSLPQRYAELEDRWVTLQHARDVLKARRARKAGGAYDGYAEALAPVLSNKFSQSHTWSASRLEAYGTCPYQFYVQNTLGLERRDPPEPGLDGSQLGSILHKILEEAYLKAADPTDTQSVLASLEIAVNRIFPTAPKVYGFRPSPLWDIEQAQLRVVLQETIKALGEQNEDWKPYAYEKVFGIRGVPPLEMQLGNETLRVRGVIDRVDINSNGELRIIDYKTGGSHLTPNDLKDGRRLQLPLYALAAQSLGLGTPVDGFYWIILGAKAGSLKLAKFKSDTGQGVQAAVDEVHAHLVRFIRGIRAGEFPSKPPKGGCPAYCPASLWCWRYEAGW